MRREAQVRFLGGGGAAMRCCYPTKAEMHDGFRHDLPTSRAEYLTFHNSSLVPEGKVRV